MSTRAVADTFRNNPEVTQEATDRYQALLARSATDMEFRAQLLSDPRAALAAFGGKSVSEIPESVNIKFIENTVDATIVLPDFVDTEAELSDRELETVAGGSDLVMTVIIVTLAVDGGLASYLIAKK
jgi:hypothetical protein